MWHIAIAEWQAGVKCLFILLLLPTSHKKERLGGRRYKSGWMDRWLRVREGESTEVLLQIKLKPKQER